MKARIYVEGGGHKNKRLATGCRQGFAKFLEKAGLRGNTVVACGSGAEAYKRFAGAVEARGDEIPVLLVDSEGPVTAPTRWEHLRTQNGDRWRRPPGASEENLHFMAQAMEAWFYADKTALAAFYERGFNERALSARLDVENIPKADLFNGLKKATEGCQKGEYAKGMHSFEILMWCDPAKVRKWAPHADRLLNFLEGN